MYQLSDEFHKKYADMYDKSVKIHFKDGSVRIGLFNDEFYEDSSILVSCEVIKIADIERMELLEESKTPLQATERQVCSAAKQRGI